MGKGESDERPSETDQEGATQEDCDGGEHDDSRGDQLNGKSWFVGCLLISWEELLGTDCDVWMQMIAALADHFIAATLPGPLFSQYRRHCDLRAFSFSTQTTIKWWNKVTNGS